MAIIVNNITIPSGVTPVTIGTLATGMTTRTGETSIKILQRGNAGVNPCSIAGVTGTMALTGDNYTFTRTTAGDAVAITRPEPIRMAGWENNDAPAIIWIGTNNRLGASPTQEEMEKNRLQVLKFVRRAVAHLTHTNYLVVGFVSKHYHSDYAYYNTVLRDEFGNHFVDLANYLLAYGLADAGITPTAADLTAIADGAMPPSLIYQPDGMNVHYTAAADKVIGEYLAIQMIDRGYIAKEVA